jgi:hypothetical protein
VLRLMNIIVYIAEYLLNGALITMSLHTTLSSSGIQEQISPTGKYSPANLVCAQPIMHLNPLMPCSSAVTQIIVAIHCLHYWILLWRPSLWTYREKLCMNGMFFTPSIYLISYPLPMPIALATDNYVILVQCSMVKLTKKVSNSTYHVDIDSSSCTCKYFHNKGYCKHLVFSFQRVNRDSNTVNIWRTFKYKGNT